MNAVCVTKLSLILLIFSENVASTPQLSSANQFALSVITYVGCGLSLFGAVGAIASFVLFT